MDNLFLIALVCVFFIFLLIVGRVKYRSWGCKRVSILVEYVGRTAVGTICDEIIYCVMYRLPDGKVIYSNRAVDYFNFKEGEHITIDLVQYRDGTLHVI